MSYVYGCFAGVHVSTPCVLGDCGGQKKALDPKLADGREPLCNCWEGNLGSLEEEQVFQTAQPFPQPTPNKLKKHPLQAQI